MALTKKQVEGVTDLFVINFVNSNDELDRKKILIQFEDAFGKSICEWKSICREKIELCTSDKRIIECYDEIINQSEQTNTADEYVVRMLGKADLEQVRELINSTFGRCLTFYDDDKFDKFIESRYSVVACNGEEIVGVALAFEMPNYNIATIYLDTFAVAEYVRGHGIGKKMLNYVHKLSDSNGAKKIKLQTDRKIDAYHIYKHWGFQEDEVVHMHGYFF